MFDPESIQRCDFCKTGQITMHYELVSFRQLSDKGYISCQAEIPLGSAIGAAHSIGTKTQKRSLKMPFSMNTGRWVSNSVRLNPIKVCAAPIQCHRGVKHEHIGSPR